MLIEGLKLDFDIRSLHDFVYLAIFLSADEFTMFIRKLNLEANFVMEGLNAKLVLKEESCNRVLP